VRPAAGRQPDPAPTLLHAVGLQRGGRRLVAFFGCLHYAALRPEEALSLAMHNLSLPEQGWGELHLERAEPYAGKEWTDSGRNRDQRPPGRVHARGCGVTAGEDALRLRHAAVSTWLNGGVLATTVAEWAGHSVEICSGATPSASSAATRRSVGVFRPRSGTPTPT
jgi:hypothetical protein